MSRIAGIVFTGNHFAKQNFIATMLETLKRDPSWNERIIRSGQSLFGWTGWEEPNIVSRNNTLVVADGLLYNQRELNLEGTTAEAVWALYRKYGFSKALERTNGDFAVALYDFSKTTLFLARDRLGVKPLYTCSTPQYFAFASQPGALLKLPGVELTLNKEYVALFAACHYRYFDHNPESSPYLNIDQLPASTVIQQNNGVSMKSKYWTLSDNQESFLSEEEIAEEYRDRIFNAVLLRLQAAKQAGFTLSGGMDSSTVLSTSVYLTQEKQPAISTVYEDRTYDESEDIQPMLKDHVSKWHTLTVSQNNIFDIVKTMVALHDEPVPTATWLSHFLLCQKACQLGVTTLFGGLGGDELNAGEYEYFPYFFADLKVAGETTLLDREIGFWIEYHDHPIYRKSKNSLKKMLATTVDWDQRGRCIPDPARLLRYAGALNRDYYDLSQFQPLQEQPFSSYLKNQAYMDLFRETLPCCLRAQDRNATSCELHTSSPFLDYRLVEWMFTIPGTMKIRKGITKWLLRKAMKGILPEETRTRIKKTGWNAPAHCWFSGKGKDFLLDLVSSQKFRERGIYNVKEVLRIIKEHHEIVTQNQPRENHMMFLWQLVNLELWLYSLKVFPVEKEASNHRTIISVNPKL